MTFPFVSTRSFAKISIPILKSRLQFMQSFPLTLVWRHRRENLKKCSLRGLEQRPDFQFFSYPSQNLPPLDNYIVLDLAAPPLTQADNTRGLLILDGTWRYASRMEKQLKPNGKLLYRSLPATFRTAYPRRQEDCLQPERGLASIEAIYVAYAILGRDCTGLLDYYYWGEAFLQHNKNLFEKKGQAT
jgi:pre-rRNA-processing protein TSR3